MSEYPAPVPPMPSSFRSSPDDNVLANPTSSVRLESGFRTSPPNTSKIPRAPSPSFRETLPSNTSLGSPKSIPIDANHMLLQSTQAKTLSKSPSPMGRHGGVVVNTTPSGLLVIDPSLPSANLPRTNSTPTRLRPELEAPAEIQSANTKGRFDSMGGGMDSWRSPMSKNSSNNQKEYALSNHLNPPVKIPQSANTRKNKKEVKIQDLEKSPPNDNNNNTSNSSDNSPDSSAASVSD